LIEYFLLYFTASHRKKQGEIPPQAGKKNKL